MYRKRSGVMSLAALLLMTGSIAAYAGTAAVQFIEPERYADVSDRVLTREEALAVLDGHIRDLASKRLPAAHQLTVEVLDVDLAGEPERRSTRFYDLRVMRETTPPAARFRYSLAEGGRVLKSGEVQLRDLAYLRAGTSSRSSTALAYDRELWTRWFKETFPSSPGKASKSSKL
jgi:hypothetical protein